MKKINIVRKNEDFNRIITTKKPNHFKSFIIYVEKIKEDTYHYGVSVSKKIGNAVVRNKIRRQVKHILDQKNYQNNFNCIIIVRKSFTSQTFLENREELHLALNKLNLIKTEKENM